MGCLRLKPLLGESITSQQVYHCAVDPELFAAKLSRTEAFAKKVRPWPGLTESPR